LSSDSDDSESDDAESDAVLSVVDDPALEADSPSFTYFETGCSSEKGSGGGEGTEILRMKQITELEHLRFSVELLKMSIF
jgi:hypothetical protein